jgi:hypothetical protein
MVGTKVLKDLEKLPKGAFTLGVRDSSVESRKHHVSHLGLKPSCHESFVLR